MNVDRRDNSGSHARARESLRGGLARERAGSRCRGFTLIEVLATMVLLALVLPAAMRGATIALSAASTAKHRTEAADLAESKLNELVVLGEWNQTMSGDFSPQHPDYRWSLQSGSRDYGVFDVTLTVSWTEAGVERQFILSTLAYDTTAVTSSSGTSGTGSTTGGL